MPPGKQFSAVGNLWVKPYKDKPYKWGLPRNCQTAQIISWAWGFGGVAPSLFCLFWWLPVSWFSPWLWAACFQGYCGAGERGMGMGHGQVKMPQNSRISWTNSSCIAGILWLISRVLKSWFWQFFFAGFPFAFMEMIIVEGPYSPSFADIICSLGLLEWDILGD